MTRMGCSVHHNMDKWLTLEVIVKWEPRILLKLEMIPALMNVIRSITARTILDFISFLLVTYKFGSYPSFLYYVLVKSQKFVCIQPVSLISFSS